MNLYLFPKSRAGSPGRENEAAPTLCDAAATRGRVLVVDDEACIRHILSSLLRAEGFAVELAADGSGALERFGSGKEFDVVLTDRSMPKMDGEELARRIKAISPQMPVILVTGTPEGLERCGSFIDAVVVKPFHRATILKIVETAVAARRCPITERDQAA